MKTWLMKFCCLLVICIFFIVDSYTQVRVTIPWSSSLNVTFGEGATNPGPPLNVGSTGFSYSNDLCPAMGSYTIVNQTNNCPGVGSLSDDAGHIFYGVHPVVDSTGYMMLVNYQASTNSKIVFSDTVSDLCSNNTYLFWAGVRKLGATTCFYPNLSLNVETVYGEILQSFQTGDIGGVGDNAAPYFGYAGFDLKTTFPSYYGGIFKLPAGVENVVLKILTNPTNVVSNCNTVFAMDNILLTPVGPDINVNIDGNTDAWIASSCFVDGMPINLTGDIYHSYRDFGSGLPVNASFQNPSVQWQQSIDDGRTWADIAGETNMNLSRVFSIPDSFFVRLRVSEDSIINNQNCSVVSNVIKVEVNGLPSEFDITSNTPVCTDSDIVFNVYGGASYVVTGPNGFYDDSPFPHVYHPSLANTGWYHAEIISLGGCKATDSTYVQVIGPILKISVDDSLLCYGEATRLHASGGNAYLWSPPDGLSGVNTPNPIATPLTTTKYQVKMTDNSGCSAYGSVTIKLRDSILKAQMVAPAIICPNDEVLFRDTSIGKIISWHWDFANGATSTSQHPPSQHYQVRTTNVNYPVTLVVNDSAGCADTSTVFVKAVNSCYIAVPSGFTPNHDGLNDYLYPLNAYKATDLVFKIYNRFGRVVFETKDWTKKWDGTISGMPQPTGTYIWILNYTDEHNTKISLKGTTVLLR